MRRACSFAIRWGSGRRYGSDRRNGGGFHQGLELLAGERLLLEERLCYPIQGLQAPAGGSTGAAPDPGGGSQNPLPRGRC
ncbi:MAG: hypothetical protein LC777_18760, partial [Actinobacteria bacterium]|nr:hypothetical protein [Actinomycetota bacterium]